MMPPQLIYDDNCGFCTRAVEYIANHGEFRLIGFSSLTPEQRDRLPANYEECAHLLTDNRVYSCDEAIEEAFVRTNLTTADIVPVLRYLPGYSRARKSIYQWIANNRDHLGTIISSEPPAQRSR
jgi:predicted DCC family thiol-disulfide oxidoreductase YuxK